MIQSRTLGKVLFNFEGFLPSYYDGISALAIQDDGKILAIGSKNFDYVIVRFNADGSLDSTYQDEGKLILDIDYLGGEATDASIVGSNSLLIGGHLGDGSAIVKIDSNGNLDKFFGDNGVFRFDRSLFYVESITIQDNGEILAAGRIFTNRIFNWSSLRYDNYYQFALSKISRDGVLVNSFGDSGFAYSSPGGSSGANDILLQSDGKIVLVGDSSGNIALTRFTSDGQLDSSFDGDGSVVTDLGGYSDVGEGAVLQVDGKIIVVGTGGLGRVALVRYHPDGSLDSSFGSGGKILTELDNFRTATGNAITFQNDGKILVAGSVSNNFVILRYLNSGVLDSSFDLDGKVVTDFGGIDAAFDLKIQNDGRIVVAGKSGYDFALARYNIDGSLDTTFGNAAPTGSVTIIGTATQGQTLTATHTLADADGLGIISYQWQANGSAISGATGSTYTLTQAEVGKTITVVARYTDGNGTAESKASAATAAVTAATTQPPVGASKDADFVVLQTGSPGIIGAGTGNDTYLLSGSMISSGKNLTLSDASGSNSLQLAPGLSITASAVSSNALKLTLSNNSTVTVLAADRFTYDIGGNNSAGLDNPDASFQEFVQGTLGTTVPTSGLSNGGALVINSGAAASLLASAAANDDFVVAQYASPAIIGAGAGNDTYLFSSSLLPAGTQLTVSDAQGSNSIQLASGLSIVSSQVASTALKLTLASGATITILAADRFTYDVGGNTTAGIDQEDVSYATFVQTVLGVTVPTSGVTNGGAATIGGTAAGGIAITGNQTVTATSASETFYFDAVVALADSSGTNTQATLASFSPADDLLRINLPSADAAITRLSQLDGQQGVTVQADPFLGDTLVNFGADSNGGQVVVLTLAGIADPGLVNVLIV